MLRKVIALVITSMVVLVLGAGTASANGHHDRSQVLRCKGRAVLTVDPDVGTFSADGREICLGLGLSHLHTEGALTADTTATFDFTITVGHGSSLIGTATTTIVFTDTGFDFTNVETITGGTGRFGGATGSATETGTATADPNDPARFTTAYTRVGSFTVAGCGHHHGGGAAVEA